MTVPAVFNDLQRDPAAGSFGLAPVLPLTLIGAGGASRGVSGLLDTGAAIGVLPYTIGIDLGLDWDAQTNEVQLTGNLAMYEARAVVVNAVVSAFDPVRLVFSPGRKRTTPRSFWDKSTSFWS